MSDMNKFADNPFYVQYEALLKDLHRLIAAGKGNEDEADAVRDEMDGPEQSLTQKETMRLNGLSADLYMLQDEEVYEPYDGTQKELVTALSEALGRLDYEAILSLLRKGTPFLRPAQVASLRGRCYAMLGHLDTALLFMRYAAEKEPEQVAHRLYILGLLTQLNRAQEALFEVESYARIVMEPLLLAA